MKRTIAIVITMLLVTAGVGRATASEAKANRRPASLTVSEYAYRKLEKAHELLAVEHYEEAAEVVDKLAERRGLNSHERALIAQIRGYVAAGENLYAEAAAAFERCLSMEALPEGSQRNTRYNLAQLYLATERFDDAVSALELWFSDAENPGAAAYYLLAAAYMQAGKRDLAFEPARRAVELAAEPKEGWLQLLLALDLESKDYEASRVILERLVEHFSTKNYWIQLSAVYVELGREADSLATMQLAYQQQLLDKDSELRYLARMYLYHDIPYRAAQVMEKGISNNTINVDTDAWELLADAWMNAKEYSKAIPPLERAAARDDSGKLYVRLGRLRMERREWGEAVTSLEQALAKKKLIGRGRATLLLGISQYSAEHDGLARLAFEKASEFEEVADAATRWIDHLDLRSKRQRADGVGTAETDAS